MKNIKHTLKHLKKHGNLSREERTLLRSKLNEYREYKPLRAERLADTARLPHVEPHGSSLFLTLKPMPLIAGLLIVASLGGGTAFAAEGALPGDVLYSVKIEINENVRSAFALNAEAKAEVEAWRAERRLNETQRLAARAELSEDVRTRLAANFAQHAERAQTRIAEISETDPALAAELSTKFEASLTAHEAILASTDATGTAPVQVAVRGALGVNANGSIAMAESAPRMMDADTATFAMVEEDNRGAGVAQKTSLAPSFNDATSAKRMYAAAQKSLTGARELYAKAKAELDVNTQERIEAHLKATGEVFAQGERQYAAGAYGEAFASFQQVVRAMSHLSVYLRAELSGDIDFNLDAFPVIEPLPIMIDLSNDTNIAVPPPTPGSIKLDTQGGGYVDPIDPTPENDADHGETNSIDVNTRVRLDVSI